jgi:serine/threonine-protein kinase
MQAPPHARWSVLSPLLDELLDLQEPQRAQRLAALRDEDAALAGELQALLDELPALERDNFLERPALLAPPSLEGQAVGPYTLERELGQGGMGSVWLARRTDGRYEGQVAIKFLGAALMARGGAQRFAREGSILARLSHPHIARLLDAGVARDGAQPYLVLEYIDGLPIDQHCEQHGLELKQRLQLFLDVLGAVAHAHNHLILHRDLKPSNILVTRQGEVKLLDFGIAKLLHEADAAGTATELTRQAGRAFTPQYAAPEQLQDGDVSTATDVYALGVLLYVLLGGRHPTAQSTATTPLDQMRAVIELQPRRLSDTVARSGRPGAARLARELRGDLDNIVAKALKKQPQQRYANAAAFAEDLRRHLDHQPVLARPDRAAYRIGKFVRRHWVGVGAGTLAMSALALGVGLATWQAREAQRQRVQAEGLIEFMLGDLRKKLQPVGRLDALDAVGEQALAYYAQQHDTLDAGAQGRRARALHLIGQIAEQRGHLEEASRVFERAAQATQALMARHPGDGQRIFDHAQSEFWVGYVAWRRGQRAAAEASFRRYLDLALRLTQLDPANVDWRIEKIWADTNLGVLLLEGGRAAEALQRFEQTRRDWTALVPTRPEAHFELANSWGWIARAREAQGDFGAAIEAQRAKIDALHQVPGGAADRKAERLLALAEDDIASLQLALGDTAAALKTAGTALARIEALAAQDPSNRDWQSQACFSRLNLAEVLLAEHQPGRALAQVQLAAAEVAQLLSLDPTRADWRDKLQGRLLELQAQLPAAAPGAARFERYLSLLRQPAAAASDERDPDRQRIAAAVEIAAGDQAAAQGVAARARTLWQQAAERLGAAGPGAAAHPSLLTLQALAELRLGHLAEARALAQRVEASPYRHPRYADLRTRLASAEGTAPAR